MMEDCELSARLGSADAATTDEQRQALRVAARMLDSRWPSAELGDGAEAAFTAAAMVILGDDTPEGIAIEYKAAVEAAVVAHARLTGAIIAAHLTTTDSEVRLATRLGVTRMTIRKALGK